MKLNELLLNWYDENARSLPWRGTKDPYRIWLSEIMLQQTRAEAVLHYYERFLNRFPDVHALAAAPQDEVLKLWEGLGYYSRARNLHAAAKHISQSGGNFPRSVEGLQALPGVGPYAARAIASIAYDLCVPALDGNQMRVLSRCFAVERILKTPFDLEEEALRCISCERPGDYNQALMDLGSAVCTPKNPKCASCPLSGLCLAAASGEPGRYPLRPAPMPKRDEELTVLLIRCGDAFVIRRREGRLLGGLYEFPAAEGHLSSGEAAGFLRDSGFKNPGTPLLLPPARHVFTHLIWHMQGLLIPVESVPKESLLADAEALRSLAFPSAIRKYHEIALNILEEDAEHY